MFLGIQLLFLFTYIVTSFHHVLMFKVMGEKWCKEVYEEESEDEEEEE